MLSFAQFLSEDDRTYKGWMSPSGQPHIVHGEHYLEHHPDIEAKVSGNDDYLDATASITKAQKLGYTRFSRHGDHHLIHFDKDSEGGRASALHALKHMDPETPTSIVVRNRPFGYGRVSGVRKRPDKHETEFNRQSDAARHIRE